jgi:hypothetical protein
MSVSDLPRADVRAASALSHEDCLHLQAALAASERLIEARQVEPALDSLVDLLTHLRAISTGRDIRD